MKNLPRHGFTLIESLAMIVVLLVFGWLCVALIRHEMRSDKDVIERPKFAHEERLKTEVKNDGKPAPSTPAQGEKPWKELLPPAPKP